jgi:hypothetical protein
VTTEPRWSPVSRWPKINSARLTAENRVYIHPICGLADGKHECVGGWTLIGWGNAPWASGLGPHAIVYEKTSSAGSEHVYGDCHAGWEPGIYWGHGNADEMLFPSGVCEHDTNGDGDGDGDCYLCARKGGGPSAPSPVSAGRMSEPTCEGWW